MKKLLSITLLLLTTLSAKAQVLEAKSLNDLVTAIQTAKFEYKERGMVFGFQTIQSCLYVSEDIAIFKNYCFPAKPYPARGYTIISKEFGMIDLYEERLQDALKRDITITQFPDVIAPYLTTEIPQSSLPGLSNMIEKMYYHFYPSCWSTNMSWESEAPEAECTGGMEVQNFAAWANETQSVLKDESAWMELMKSVEIAINR